MSPVSAVGEAWSACCTCLIINHIWCEGWRGCLCIIRSASSGGTNERLGLGDSAPCCLPGQRLIVCYVITGNGRTSWTSRASRSWWRKGKFVHLPHHYCSLDQTPISCYCQQMKTHGKVNIEILNVYTKRHSKLAWHLFIWKEKYVHY